MDKASCGLFYYKYDSPQPDAMTNRPAQRACSLGVILLAAGKSSRMGRPKLLLPWNGTTVLGHLLRQWRGLKAKQIAVVCSAGGEGVWAELDRLGVPATDRVRNPRPERGMFSSVQCAARWPGWRKEISHFAIVLGDQPHLKRSLLRRVLEFSAARAGRICQPERRGHGRHPVILPRAQFRQLARSRARTLKSFLQARAQKVARCELNDPGLDLDMDRPADYRRALRWAHGPAQRRQTSKRNQ